MFLEHEKVDKNLLVSSNEDTLDKIVMMLKNKGIMADHNDFFDVS